MAVTLSISATVQDADAPDTLAALKLKFASNGTPNPTQAQLRTALENEWRDYLKGMVRQYRRDNAAIADVVMS